MTQQLDQAAKFEQQDRERALAAQRAAQPQGESLRDCEDCGDPIPEARRRAAVGCRMCIECAEFEERRRA